MDPAAGNSFMIRPGVLLAGLYDYVPNQTKRTHEYELGLQACLLHVGKNEQSVFGELG